MIFLLQATSCSQENLPCLDNCQTSHLQNNDWTASGFHIVLTWYVHYTSASSKKKQRKKRAELKNLEVAV